MLVIQEIARSLLFRARSSNYKYSYLGIIISLYFIQYIRRLLRVPPQLRHIPHVGYFSIILSVLKQETLDERTQRLIMPKLSSTGSKFYLSRFPVSWTVYTIDPVAVKTILMKTEQFPKTQELLKTLGDNNPFGRLIGQRSLVSVNGHEWRNQRKIMNLAIQRAMPVQLIGGLAKKMIRVIEKSGGTVIAIDVMHRFSLDTLGLTAFNFDFESLDKTENNEWTEAYTNIQEALKSPIPVVFAKYDWALRYILPGRSKLLKNVDRLNGLLLSIAEKRRQEIKDKKFDDRTDGEKDLLTLILESELREDGFIDNEEIKCNLALFFVAGHETTSHAMAFCLYNLALNKDVQNKARQQVIEVLGDEPQDIIPTVEECKFLPYIDMVIKENIRRFNIADLLSTRRAEQDTTLGNTFIPKGTSVSTSLHVLHHDPDLWKDPYSFNPERFAKDGEYEQTRNDAGYSYIPFSHGGRQCIGMNLSMAEQRVALIMLLRKFNFELPQDSIHKNGIQIKHFQNFAPRDLLIHFEPRY